MADSALTVGRHSLAGVDALVGDVAVLKGIAAEAHEFSTTAGGKAPMARMRRSLRPRRTIRTRTTRSATSDVGAGLDGRLEER